MKQGTIDVGNIVLDISSKELSEVVVNGMATNFVSLSDPANIESIEVIKGPSGTLFGTTLISYGGLINRVTKKAYDKQGGEISVATGAWGLGRLTADYNTPLDKEKKVLFRLKTVLQIAIVSKIILLI